MSITMNEADLVRELDRREGERRGTLPTTTAERKAVPMASGVLDYFPAALAYVAKISKAGNDKHNPGQSLHHARGKSMDHADCIMRHLVDRGTVDPEDKLRHSGKIAWRALALLQEELEREEGAPLARAAKVEPEPPKMIVADGHPLAGWVQEVTKPNAAGTPIRVYPNPADLQNIAHRYTDGPREIEGCIL